MGLTTINKRHRHKIVWTSRVYVGRDEMSLGMANKYMLEGHCAECGKKFSSIEISYED